MAALALRLIFLIFLISISQARILNLNSFDDYLISDGLDHTEDQESFFNHSRPSISNTCQHQYGFLPCAENIAGYIFQIFVYQVLLVFGEHQVSSGSEVVLNILGIEYYGGIIFRILMVLPSMMLVIVSGVFGSKENAQSQVSGGVGTYAGITVFSLTLQWGICVIFGRTNLRSKSNEHSQMRPSNDSYCLLARGKLIKLKDTGVSIVKYTRETRETAKIMLLSLIPYVIVQLTYIFNTSSGKRIVTLIALIVSFSSLIAYFIHQISNEWTQKMSLDYSKHEALRTGFLQHLQQLGELVDEDGELNNDVIKKLFAETDKDGDKSITKDEMKELVVIVARKLEVEEEDALEEVMKAFDFNEDKTITEKEFREGCQRWIDDAKNKDSPSRNIFRGHAEKELLKSKLLFSDGEPDTEKIKNLFKQFANGDGSISKSELEQLIRNVKFGEFQLTHEGIVKEVFKDFDKDSNNKIEEPEFLEGIKRWLDKAIRVAKTPNRTQSIDVFDKIVWGQGLYDKWAIMKSLFQVSIGIVILTFLGGPLMDSILQLSHAMRLSSFSISFVVVPLAMNARVAISALFPVSKKSQTTVSLIFSERYGLHIIKINILLFTCPIADVARQVASSHWFVNRNFPTDHFIMNNISGLTTLLLIVYVKELTWDFSAEVLTILVVCAIIGILAYTCDVYPLWTCILAFFLYPFSLGLFYLVQVFLNWN
ncbi:Calmodulin and related proteins (EF-Hand superfamily) [Handroanthus impetiginosus]|uniref:Calmodulin and related proteins (EF-Hand superfamily) n=1 Tax=Handroanthus impetiginosus TaxID=429701 RepID=A0A2G9I3F3_9LAMI|nr:Calmodulin and related proteins (EF-Hand superfamily) [Handroanthus impetiginosus]